MEIILKMSFFTLNHIEINYSELEISSKTYISIKTVNITKQIQIVEKKRFCKRSF